MSSYNNKQRREPWRNAERHYCAICNVWMGSDRQSILFHENGKKHKEKVEESLQKRRREKLQQEKDQKFLQASLQQMEQSAMQKVGGGGGGGTIANSAYRHQQNSYHQGASTTVPIQVHSSLQQNHQQKSSSSIQPAPSHVPSSNQEKKDWMSQKQKRQEERERKRKKNDDESDDNKSSRKQKRQRIEPGEGHYSYNNNNENDEKIYLEGTTFYEILEEDMPVQLWVGSQLAAAEEKRLAERNINWKDALIVSIRHKSSSNNDNKDNEDQQQDDCTCLVHVAYLASSDDTEETIEKNVAMNRIRIILGADDSIPDTLEEARLLAMGGEEIKSNDKDQKQEIDEATGLSTWSTVSVKRTTVRQEIKEERARAREQRKQAILEQEKQKKEAEARRMEEAKVANADDSALGAYDVWGTGGYKGINIQKEAAVKVEDTAKSLASGKGAVSFKKKFKKKNAAKRNRRTTSADDDD